MPAAKKNASQQSRAAKNDRAIANDRTNDGRVHASVIVHSASGKSAIKDRGKILPQNVKSYLASETSLQEAAREIAALGFRVDLIAPTHINISAPAALFETVFACKIAPKSFPLFAAPSRVQQQVFVADRALTVPPSLEKLVEAVDLEPPVIFNISPIPPALSYDHMELPDDVARGMDAIKAHERSINGAGINFAMVDTGFMTPFHPYYTGKGYTINPVVIQSGDDAHTDDDGHGTGVAACALAVAPGVSFTMYKMGGVPTFAFSTAAQAKPDVITNSWEVNPMMAPLPALQMAINNAVADGIVVVFSCGNGANPPAWPASEPAVIAVGGAFLDLDDSIQASNYARSGTNSINPGRQVPDVCGLVGLSPQGIYIAEPTQPGSDVDVEFYASGAAFPNGDETTDSDGWLVVSGTSAATPMVAGVCALMMQADATLKGNPSAVRTKLSACCIDVTSGMSANGELAGPGPDNATGAGLVQGYRAVHATDIWMRDNPDSDIGLVPTTGRRPAYPPYTHWTSPDMKLVASVLTNPHTDFDGAAEVDPIFNQDNFLYARLRNRGTQDASSVQLGIYYADPSTSLAFPTDWDDGQTGVPAKGSITVSGTMTNSQTLPTVPANGSVVTPVPFVWRPPDPSSATQSQTLPDGRVEGHFCLLSRLASADDPILFPSGGESSVIDDNNISMKNEHVYSAKSGGKHHYRFFVRSSDSVGASRDVQLIADVAGLPARTVIAIQIPALKINHNFTVEHAKTADVRTGQREPIALAAAGADSATVSKLNIAEAASHHAQPLVLGSFVLKPGREALATVTLQVPKGTPAGSYPFPIGQKTAAELSGGVTLIARIT